MKRPPFARPSPCLSLVMFVLVGPLFVVNNNLRLPFSPPPPSSDLTQSNARRTSTNIVKIELSLSDQLELDPYNCHAI